MTGAARRPIGRRRYCLFLGSGLLGTLAGCSAEPTLSGVDVVAGPDGRLAFEPERLPVAAGSTVTWGFASAGHNVACRPAERDLAAMPAGAEPFASFGADQPPTATVVPRGGTFSHAFEVPGTYHYVCVPHLAQGMTGTVAVT